MLIMYAYIQEIHLVGIYYISNPVPMTVDGLCEQDSIPGLLNLFTY